MATRFVIKICWNNETRRIALERAPAYQDLVSLAIQLFNVVPACFKYEDDEKDVVTVTSDRELSEAICVAEKSKSVLKVIVIEVVGNVKSTIDTPLPYLEGSPVGAPTLEPVKKPAWMKGMQPWVWTKIPGTALSSVTPMPRPPGDPKAKIEAWCGATLKREGSVYMLGAAGGHADYAGNEVDALDLLADRPKWAQLHAPTKNEYIINGTQFYLDLRPSCTHTYYATQFIDALNRMMVFASPGVSGSYPEPPPNFPYTGSSCSFSFDLTKMEWDSPNYVAVLNPVNGDWTACLCVKHPLTGDVYYSRAAGSWLRWTRAANRWDKLSNATRSDWYSGAAIDSKRNRMLVVGGYAPTDPLVLNLDGSNVAVTFKGLGAAALKITNYPGVIYDEANDQFVVLYNDWANNMIKVLVVTAEDFTVSAPPISGTPPTSRTNGIQNSVQYVPQLHGFVIANTFDGDVYFVSMAKSVGESAPTVLEATPVEEKMLATLAEMGFSDDVLSVLRDHDGDIMATIKALLQK